MKMSQSPQIGSMFLTRKKESKIMSSVVNVAIPSNRVNVSYPRPFHSNADSDCSFSCRNPLKSGQCFLPFMGDFRRWLASVLSVAIPSNRVNVSYLKKKKKLINLLKKLEVAIPSNRVNVSYEVHFIFLFKMNCV